MTSSTRERARYDYGDGRIVCRDPKKVFKQLGNTKGTNLYGLDSLSNDGPVYVVEGEKTPIPPRMFGTPPP